MILYCSILMAFESTVREVLGRDLWYTLSKTDFCFISGSWSMKIVLGLSLIVCPVNLVVIFTLSSIELALLSSEKYY
jgi:hypothetical protein